MKQPKYTHLDSLLGRRKKGGTIDLRGKEGITKHIPDEQKDIRKQEWYDQEVFIQDEDNYEVSVSDEVNEAIDVIEHTHIDPTSPQGILTSIHSQTKRFILFLWTHKRLSLSVFLIVGALFYSLGLARLAVGTYVNYQNLSDVLSSDNIAHDAEEIHTNFDYLEKYFAGFTPPGSLGKELTAALKGGKHLSSVAASLAGQYEDLGEKYATSGYMFTDKDFSQLYDELAQSHVEIENAITHLTNLTGSDRIGSIDGYLEQLDQVQSITRSLLNNREGLYSFLAMDKPHRWFVLFQNQDELRASGGFPGSAAIMEVDKGRITSFSLRDIYGIDWHHVLDEPSPPGINQFYRYEGSRDPIQLTIRDANWFPEFYESNVIISRYLESAGFGSFDGVIGVNQGMIQDLLRLTGPIRLPNVPEPITSENFSILMSLLVESKIFKNISPKDILFQFAGMLDENLSLIGYTSAARSLLQQLLDHEVVFASNNGNIQAFFDDMRLVDRWRFDEGNWFGLLFTSYSKNKSDRWMQRNVTVAQKGESCEFEFTIRAQHNFPAFARERFVNWMYTLGIEDVETMLSVQGEGANRHYMRLLAPPGSLLTSSNGNAVEEVYSEKYSQFAWYQETSPLSSSDTSFVYQVPEGRCDDIPFFYKPPGANNIGYEFYDQYGNQKVNIAWEK